jgi:hypothetical protein
MISEGCEHVICLPSDNVTLKIEYTNCAKEPQYDSKPHCQRVFPRAQSTTKKQKKVAQSTVMAQAKSSVEKKNSASTAVRIALLPKSREAVKRWSVSRLLSRVNCNLCEETSVQF